MNDGMDGFAYYRLASVFTEIQLNKYLISAHVCRARMLLQYGRKRSQGHASGLRPKCDNYIKNYKVHS